MKNGNAPGVDLMGDRPPVPVWFLTVGGVPLPMVPGQAALGDGLTRDGPLLWSVRLASYPAHTQKAWHPGTNCKFVPSTRRE
ncbi:MAG: hypothetical protein WC364_13355 [Eubacteriales bacterium]|jgi:hypothetical protein